MRRAVNERLEMATRVRAFCRAHPSTEPGYDLVLGRLEELLTRGETIAAKQFEGLAAAKSARLRRRELRKVVHFQLLRYLISVGGIAAKTQVELAERFNLPDSSGSNRAFLTAVKSMLALAEAQRDALLKEGMSPRLLEDLSRMLAEFEAVSEVARKARLDHIGARAEMDQLVLDILEQVRVLDGINRWRLAQDPNQLIEWNAAKHVPGGLGTGTRVSTPATGGNTGDAAGGGEAPPSGGAAPAA